MNKIPTSVWTVLLFVLALGVRLLHITDTDIAGDEPFSIFMSQLDLSSMVYHLSKDNSPPLFEIILHIYTSMVGSSDFALRLLPSLFSALVPVILFLIGKRFFNLQVGVVAAALAIFSIYHIRFAHEIRVYSLFSLLTAGSLFFFLSAVKNISSLKYWLGLVLTDVLLLYAHYTSLYVVIAQTICCLLFVPWRSWKWPLLAFIAIGVSYLPYVMVLFQRLGEVSGSGTWVPKPGWGEVYGNVNLLLNSKFTSLAIVVSVLLAVALQRFQLKSVFHRLYNSKSGLILILYFTVPYLGMFTVSMLFLPMFMDRYVLYTSVPLFLLVARVVTTSWNKHRYSLAGLAIVVIGSVVTTDFNPTNNRNIKETVNHLRELNVSGSPVYVCPEMFHLAVAYHLDRDIFSLVDNENPTRRLDSALASKGFHFIRSFDGVLSISEPLVYLNAASEFVHPDNGILSALRDEMNETDHFHHHEIFDIYLFEPK